MAAPIEEQMHQFVIEQEEERCRTIDAKHNETRAMKEKRRQIPKPWERPSKKALCQNVDVLLMVGELDYDLTNPGFQEYCSCRGVLHVAGEPGSKRWKLFEKHETPKDDFLKDHFFWFAEEVGGKAYRFTPSEMEISWRVIRLGRAKLQDCWELYSNESRNQ